MLAKLRWVEGAFATGRQLWFGPAGNLGVLEPPPAGTTHDPGKLQSGQTYEWRVDQIGPGGTVTGHTWRFTTGDSATVEDFEDYTGSDAIAATWVHNIGPDFSYVFLDTGTVQQGAKAMRFGVPESIRAVPDRGDAPVRAPAGLDRHQSDGPCPELRGRRDNLAQPSTCESVTWPAMRRPSLIT